ncbi:hypothetical protein [Acinetobacter pragensis]|uniref:hypothetical protein n=1 Tax=Acinetobacter pragensis TaxID=1806892 RepID=UPI00333FE954
MKILIGFILGLLSACAVWYSLPQLHRYLPNLPMPTARNDNAYSHEPNGKILQSLDYVSGEEFDSTEGNEALLYQLKNKCKLTLSAFGESHQYKISFYFHQGKIQSAFQTSYSYPNGGFYAEYKTNEAFETQQQFLKIMNPLNIETIKLFDEIASQFKPVLINAC